MSSSISLPSQRVLRAIFLVVLALAFLTGCSGETTRPEPVTGRYALVSVDGGDLPRTIFEEIVEADEGSFHLLVQLVGGYLDLTNDGRGYDQRLEIATRIDHGPVNPYRWTDRGVVSGPRQSLAFASLRIENVAFPGVMEGGAVETSQDILYHVNDLPRVTHFRFEK